MKMDDVVMKQAFSQFDKENDTVLYRIYGVVMATLGKMMLLGSLSSFANKYFLIGFSKTRMILIQLDLLGKPKESQVIHFHDMKSVQIANWMFGMGKKINIELTDGSTIRLKVSKKVIGLKEQKENLDSVCNLLSIKKNH